MSAAPKMYEDLLGKLDRLISESSKRSKLRRVNMLRGVRATDEFRRIVALPRREWSKESAEWLADELTAVLRTPSGTMKLRPIQAIALLELGLYGGLLGPIAVGQGKTLITLLAPYVCNSARPLLILPSKLVHKTRHDQAELTEHWRIPYWTHMVSYESLGRVSHATYLHDLKPDLIMCDESHFIKNPKAAVTRRVKRYVQESNKCTYAFLSGTITARSLKDFGHLSAWSLKEHSPLPMVWAELDDWANAVDHKITGLVRTAPGVLQDFAGGSDDLEEVREGVARRIRETPGVVATQGAELSCSLRIERHTFEHPKVITEAFSKLRSEWATPDGYPLVGGLDVYRLALQLCLGFYYKWDPRPPKEWVEARRAWGAFVRHVLQHNRKGIDSELAVAQACARGELGNTEYLAWREIKKTYKPNQVAVWLSTHAIEHAVNWLHHRKHGAIVFTKHVEFAERLAEAAGVPYCGRQGETKDGKYIETFKGQSMVASLDSNKEGRNLQTHWHTALVPCPPSMGGTWEQLLGRFHRPGQQADTVEFHVWSLCAESEQAWKEATEKATYIGQTTGQIQKLQYADIIWQKHQSTGPIWVR